MEGNIIALFDRLDLLLTYGSMSYEMRNIMTTTLTSLYDQEEEWEEVVRFAIVLFMHCPEYSILK